MIKTTARTESTGSPSPATTDLFRALFEQAAVGIAEIETASDCFLRVNRHYAEIVGHSPSEIERLDFKTFIHSDDLAAYQNNARRLAAGEIREFALEMRCRRKDSKFVWVSLAVSPLWAPGELPRSHVAVVEDVTIRKQMAAEVRQRSHQLQLLSQAAQQINTCLEVPVILRRLVTAALELTDAEGGAAGLLIEGQMVFTEYNRLGQLMPVDYRFAPGYGVPGWVLETRAPYTSADAEHDPHVVPEIQRALGFRTLADVPILSRAGEMLGCFEIHNKADHEEFTAQDVELLQGLAASAAVALENARLLAERERTEAALQGIEWMLNKSGSADHARSPAGAAFTPAYGDLLPLNTCRVILDAVGQDVLVDIIGDYLDLLDTSAAVYERNGDYALGIFSSGWCRFMDEASRNLCGTADNRQALACGRWHCHESCWTDVSRRCMETGEPVDRACAGGLNLYAVPIRAGREIIGSINVGYGDPPRDPAKLQELAAKYGVDVGELTRHAEAYESRPRYIVELAKRRLGVSARLIGEIVERRQAVESLREGEGRLRAIIEQAPFGAHSYELHAGERLVLTAANRSADRILGIDHSPLLGRSIEEAFPGLRGTTVPDAYRRLATTEGNFEDEQVVLDQGKIRGAFAIHAFHTGANRMTVFFRDVTERKRAEEKLAKSEERYRGLLTNLGAGVVVHAPDTVIVSHNSRATELLGLTDEQMRGQKAFDPKWKFINSDGKPCRIEEYPVNQIVRERRAIKDLVFGIERPATNDVVWVSVNGVPVLDGKGEIFEIVVSFIDITERKHAEDALRMSKDLLSQTERIGNVGGWSFNIDTMAQAWTDEVYHIHEIDIGPNPSVDVGINYYTEESRPIIEKAVQHAIEHGVEFDLELEIITARGNRRAVHTIGKADLKKRRVYGFFQDITERKRAEQSLQASERRFEQLLQNAFDVVVILDANGIQRYVSASAERMHGYAPAELVNIAVIEGMIHPDDQAMVQAAFLQIIATGEGGVEYRHRRKAGGWVHLEARGINQLNNPDIGGVVVNVRDITERKRAEEALRESQVGLEVAQATAKIGSWEYDPRAGRATLSKEMARLFDLAPGSEPPSRSAYLETIHPDDRAAVVQAMEQVDNGVEAQFEYRSNPERGPVKHLANITRAVRNPDGSLLRLTGTIQDVTERKRAEEALKESESLLRRSQYVAQLGSYYFDARIGTLISSPGLDKLFGIDDRYPKNTEGWMALIHPEDREMMLQYFRDHVLAGRNRFDKTYRIVRHDDGRERWVYGLGELEFDAQGNTTRMIGTIQDVTERKLAEQALRQSEARLSSLFRAVAIGIGIEAERVMQEVNEAACQMVGYSREELIGQPSRMVYASDDDYAAAGGLHPLLSTQSVATAETRWRKKDGTIINIIINIAPIEPQHPDRGVTFVALDVTERKRTEAERERLQSQLTQAQKMESVGRLAGGVAHDFNNMLQVILGNVSLALMDLPANSPVRESLEEISKSAQRSADLTRQLLAFARKQTIQPKLLDLNDTVAGMLKMLRRLIGEDINLSWMPGANLWWVKMDPSQIDQVLANLCVNSRDAIEGVGTVTIETTNVTLDDAYVAAHPEAVAGDYVQLAVSDTGKGMDAETRAHLFEPFFTTKEVGKGTGLGLATVFGIVKQNQGLISFYSEPGRGATFKIHLPRDTDEAVVAEQPQRQRSLLGSETVLFVEDEKQILQLGKGILVRHGYTVLAALTPEAALALALAHPEPISLLITDVVMPGMNGKELREKLRSRQPELKCLFISGYTSDVIAHHGVLEHDVQFLQKPFTIESLAARVREVLEQPHDLQNRPSRTK